MVKPTLSYTHVTGENQPRAEGQIKLKMEIDQRNIMDERIEIEDGHVVMYRPTGPEEYQLVADSGFTKWPPRLEGQPIFYPVTNENYARQITEQWNIRESGVGYVFKFLVQQSFTEKFTVEKVGSKEHTEWWIPAEQMDAYSGAT